MAELIPDAPPAAALEDIEVDLLLEAVYRRYGYDFRGYSRASVVRRLHHLLDDCGCASVSELIPRLLHDGEWFARVARSFSIPVTEMFRDPFVWRVLRERVVPLLRTWPHVKVWHAGCASGEEVYSLAIMLREEDLYRRATIYATDYNDEALQRARAGIYELDKLQEATRGYQESGGRASFSEYYHARYGAAAMDAGLRERVVFSGHNLASDRVFGEMHLVLCRNVLIYFDQTLQNRALGLFTDSLVHGGFLCLGTKETLDFSAVSEHYEVVDAKARIYRKRAQP
jgi:chemotaxis protein methyltransferase CheR